MFDLNQIVDREMYKARVKAGKKIATDVIEILQESSKCNWEEKEKRLLDFCNEVIEESKPFLEEQKITTYLYRPHRGNLAEAIAQKKEFINKNEMFNYIANDYKGSINKEDLLIDEEIMAAEDSRIGWKDVRMVLTKRCGPVDYMKEYGQPVCVGYCAKKETTFNSFWNRVYAQFVYEKR